jgi:glycosyltransferase involved in cell wall biosynthesis
MVVHSHYSPGEVRGERHARAAVQAGYDVHVICLGSRKEPMAETIDDIGVLRLPIAHARGTRGLRVFYEYFAFALLATIEVLKLHRRIPIDVVYVHAPPDFLIVAAIIPRLMNKGVIIDIHDLSSHMFEVRFGDRGLARFAERVLQGVEVAACGIADQVVTVHRQYRDELVAHGVNGAKITVVMNAPDETVLGGASNAVVESKRSDSFTIAYHGTITRWYGVDLMIEAMAQLDGRISGLRGLVLGEGDALAAVERLARDRNLGERIEFSGRYLPQAEALRRVACADCGVIPNRASRLNRFALSSKLLDYVSLGIPVVVSRLETLEAHFRPDEVTFFAPDDSHSLAEAIAWVAENPLAARERAERARLRAEEYSWPVNRERLLAALSRATS